MDNLIEIDSDGEFVPDYSNFPFDVLTIDEIALLMIESIKLDDMVFASACREVLKKRKDNGDGAFEGEIA